MARAEDRREPCAIVTQPLTNLCGSACRLEADGIAERGVGKSRWKLREPGQGAPRRLLAHGKVRVTGPLTRLLRADADAQAQSQAHKTPEGGEFVLRKRALLVVAGSDARSRCERIGFVEHRVGDRNGEIAHGVTHDHVAEVDESRHAQVARIVIGRACTAASGCTGAFGGNDHVVVVGVAVDCADGQSRESRHVVALVVREQALDCLAQLQVGDQRHVLPARVEPRPEVPVKLAMQRRMIEVLQRAVNGSNCPAEIAEKLGRVPLDGAQRPAGDPGQQAHKVPHARLGLNLFHIIAGQRGNDARAVRRGPAEVGQDRVLALEQSAALQRVGDLEHMALTIRCLDQEVLVTLAGERGGGAANAEQVRRESLGRRQVEPGRVCEQGHA